MKDAKFAWWTGRAFITLVGMSLAAAACAPTHVQTTQSYSGPELPRPDIVIVREFAVTPDQVKLDSGLSARARRVMSDRSITAQEIEVAHRAAAVIAATLVNEIQHLGLPAMQADGTTAAGKALIIDGQVLAIDEGNRTRRNLIGLGAGRSEIDAEAQIYYLMPATGSQLLQHFTANAESGNKPGAAETMGVGGAVGRAAESTVVGVGAGVASETLGTNVDADGQRMAKAIAKKLSQFFVRQGWIPATVD